ncbi:MAG: hypothetical protein IKN55_12015 [Oscillospiraceae bacterium]|nr:hypothetical protein [Oscillospiraceae bacterium]
MKQSNFNRGSVELFLTREFFNSLVTVLDRYSQAQPDNKFTSYAVKLKEKMMRHGRQFTHEGVPQIVIYFYENEAAMLIKLLAIYYSATEPSSADFFSAAVNKSIRGESKNADQ